jgi:hypothetical protein
VEVRARFVEIVLPECGHRAMDLVEGDIHPELFDLVDALEEQLVVVRPRLLGLLEREQLRHAQVALILGEVGHGGILGEKGAFLQDPSKTEQDQTKAGPSLQS